MVDNRPLIGVPSFTPWRSTRWTMGMLQSGQLDTDATAGAAMTPYNSRTTATQSDATACAGNCLR